MNAKGVRVAQLFGGVPAESAPESDADPTPVVPGFDGGARRDQPAPPESHGVRLGRLLRGEVAPGQPE